MVEIKKKKEKKAKKKEIISYGRVYGKFSFNNTLLSLTRTDGRVLKQVSCGYIGFKNTKKSTPFAAQKCADAIAKSIVEDFHMKEIDLLVRGIGAGRDVVIKRLLNDSNFSLNTLIDRTPIAHGGCRPRKAPRK